MFTVLYKCSYRDHWYDDLPPYNTFAEAQAAAHAVARNRGSIAIVLDQFNSRVDVADYR